MEPPIKFTPHYTKPEPASDLTVDLSTIPDGWWLYGLFHNHTPIRFAGEVHEPMALSTHGVEPWSAKLQHHRGGRLTEGTGLTPAAALRDAIMSVELAHDFEEGEGER